MTPEEQTAYEKALNRIKRCRRRGKAEMKLDLSGLKLTTLPPEIGELSTLTWLDVTDNQLTTLPPEIGKLSTLTRFFLENNQLTSLPPEIGQLANLAELYLHGNPGLALPLEILGPLWLDTDDGLSPTTPRAILDYYFTTRGSQGRALREVKLVFVGRGEVGKSSMVDVLQRKRFIKHRPRTDGIAITPWDVKLRDGKATVLMWDFGGQEIMHGTHQFFLTHRSVYVVMVDGRHNREKQDAEYWLKLVRAFGGDSPVLVVMNRQKGHAFDMDREYLAQKYGVAREHFFRTDCQRPQDIAPLRAEILKVVGAMLAQEERFPTRCWDVKIRLGDMKSQGEDYFSEDQYADICQKHGIADVKEQQKLLRRLADLGTIVSFPDDIRMAELSVLNPEWATDGIYRVVTNEPLREQKHGQLKLTDLRSLLPKNRWPRTKHLKYILDLMEKFELCFPVSDEMETVLVPELLPDKTPSLADWDAGKCVVFVYRYTVLPQGILPRFITRTHVVSHGRERWRSGVVLADDGAEALVKADYDADTISVWVRGDHKDARRALLKVVRHHFDSINGRIKDLNPKEFVAVPGHPEVLVPYRALIQDERRGKKTYAVTLYDGTENEARTDWLITELLNGVESPTERRKAAELVRKKGHGGDTHIYYGDYVEGDKPMNDDHSINLRDNYGQLGQTLNNCANMIQQQSPGGQKELLELLHRDADSLIARLPAEKKQSAADDLELLIKGADEKKPNRKWYSMSAEGLLEASKFAKDFSGNIAGTVGQLGKLIWPDFTLPSSGNNTSAD